MKRTTANSPSQKITHYLIAFLLVAALSSSVDLFGQCQGFAVTISGPPTQTYCAGDTITFTSNIVGGTAPFSYQWNTGGTGPTEAVVVPQTGASVSLTVTDANGCVVYSNNITLKHSFLHAYISVKGDLMCGGQGNAALDVKGTLNADNFVWSTGETTSPILVGTSGTYSVTVSSNSYGCTKELEITLDSIPLPTVEILGDLLTCEGVPATLNATGGPYAEYIWGPNGEASPELITDVPGIYTVTVTDDNGCMGEDDFEVLPFTEIPPTLSAPPFLCPESTGIVEVVNASDYLSFNWSNGQQNPSVIAFPAENYEVTVTDPNGCTETQFIYVGMHDIVFPGIVGDGQICEGQDTAILSIYPPFVSYQWSTNETTQAIDVSTTDLYSVTVTDGNGCTTTGQHLVQSAPFPTPTIPAPPASCTGNPVELTVNGGPYPTYVWSTGETSDTITVDTSGNYEVTVSNDFGCTASTNLEVTMSAGPTATVSSAPYNCDGTLTLIATGGENYTWSNGDSTATTIVQNNGIYSVIVTDSVGCTATAVDTIAIPTVPQVSISGSTALCAGASGNLTASSGFAQYLWSGGETTEEISVTQFGNFSVTVTDDNGCTATANQSVAESPSPEPIITGPSSFCENGSATLQLNQPFTQMIWSNGNSNQSINISQPATYTVTVTNAAGCTGTGQIAVTEYAPPTVVITGPTSICIGGSANFSVANNFTLINWSTGETTSSINVNAAGNYQVTVTDANGCTNIDDQDLEIGTSLSPVIVTTPTFCEGEMTLDAGGGFNTYLWSNGENSQTTTVNTNGTYSVTVSDGTGCMGEDDETVTMPIPPTINITGPTAVCFGEMANLTADPGFTSYEWLNGETSASISVSQPNTYSVVATDVNGCSAEASLDFTINPLPMASITGPTSICNGSMVSLEVPGNFTQISWSTGETSPTINVTQSGTYSVIVTDANGCTNEAEHDLETGSSLTPVIVASGNICDGTATLDAGASYSTYLWSNGETTSAITVTSDGSYAVTVSDPTGCSGEDMMQVSIPVLPQVSIVGPDFACEGELATLTANAGFASYEWSNGASTSSIDVSQTGIYEVIVTDANGCTASAEMLFESFQNPVVAIIGPSSVCTGSQAQLSVSGNFTQVAWSNGATSNDISVSQAGTYSVVVSDDNGCTAEATHNLEIGTSPTPVITTTDISCDGWAILDAGGGFSNYSWSNGGTGQNITIYNDGMYAVTISDSTGCSGETTLMVTLPEPPLVEILGTPFICTGSSTECSVSNNFSQIEWSTGEIANAITVSSAGIYSVTVTDANGCTSTDEWVVDELQADYTFLQEEACSALDTGTVETMLTNQLGCDSLVVTSITLAPELTSTVSLTACEGSTAEFNGVAIAAGMVQEFVFSASSGCDSVVTVSVGALPSVAFDLSATKSCWNAMSGTIQVDMQNGTAPFQYELNGGGVQTNPVFTNLSAGQHNVLVSDANGCIFSQNIEVLPTEPLHILIEEPSLTCEENRALLQPTVVSGDMANIQWLWSDGSTKPWMIVESAGNYLLQVDDGCEVQEIPIHVSLVEEQREGDFFFIPNTFSPNYDGINDMFKVYPGLDFTIKSFEFKIFDRWGDMMFGTTNIEEGWDGMYRNMQQQPAAYVWYVKAKLELCGGREIDFFKEGGVTIMR